LLTPRLIRLFFFFLNEDKLCLTNPAAIIVGTKFVIAFVESTIVYSNLLLTAGITDIAIAIAPNNTIIPTMLLVALSSA